MDRDLKDSLKKIEEKKSKYEKTERLIIILSGLVSVLIFAIIGLNVYTGLNTKVSEPEVVIKEENIKPIEKEKITETKTENVLTPKEQKDKSVQIKKETNKSLKFQETQNPIKYQETAKKETKSLPEPTIPKKETEIKKETPKTQYVQYKYSIQLAAFKSKRNAEKYIKKLKLNNAFIFESKGFFRVMVGKFKTKKEAINFKKQKSLKGYIKRIN